MATISGTFYRVDGDYSLKGLTALNVLTYEAQELGNADALKALLAMPSTLFALLATLPASNLLWVTRTIEDAMRYARDEDGNDVEDLSLADEHVTTYNVLNAVVIIPDDGDGGLLILTQ